MDHQPLPREEVPKLCLGVYVEAGIKARLGLSRLQHPQSTAPPAPPHPHPSLNPGPNPRKPAVLALGTGH